MYLEIYLVKTQSTALWCAKDTAQTLVELNKKVFVCEHWFEVFIIGDSVEDTINVIRGLQALNLLTILIMTRQ